MPFAEFDIGINTNNNNGLKFVFSSILFYPLVECLLDRFILKLATLRALNGENPHLRYTRLGFFGPNTVYWGSPKWRYFILFGALVYSSLQLAGEFGFGSHQVDRQKRGTFQKRALITDPRFYNMKSLDVHNHGSLDTGDALMCRLSGALGYRLRRSPYPAEFRNGTLEQKLAWCFRGRDEVNTSMPFEQFGAELPRHCQELSLESRYDYRLMFNGRYEMRSALTEVENPGNDLPPDSDICEANRVITADVEGFAVGAYTKRNQFFCKFDIMGMKPKLALLLYQLPPSKMVHVKVRERFFSNRRYFAHGNLACVELRRDLRMLCLETTSRNLSGRNPSITLNLTEWNIHAGRGLLNKNYTYGDPGPAAPNGAASYAIRRTGLIMSFTTATPIVRHIASENYRKFLALYELLQLPMVRRMYMSQGWWQRTKSNKYSMQDVVLMVRVLAYRISSDKVLIRTNETETAFRATGQMEMATMNAWAILFYIAPVFGILILVLLNIVYSYILKNKCGVLARSAATKLVAERRLAALVSVKIDATYADISRARREPMRMNNFEESSARHAESCDCDNCQRR